MGFMDIRGRIEIHAAKFVDGKRLATPTDACLPEKNGSWRNQLNPAIDERCQERHYGQDKQNQKDVQTALPRR